MPKYSIGLDFGSDSVRALLVDCANGQEVASAVHNYSRWAQGLYSDAVNNQFRQHPLDYIEGLELTIKSVLKAINPVDVVGIAVDTTGSTPCAVDRDGTPLALTEEFKDNPNAMFVLWKDHTAVKEASEINSHAASSKTNYIKYEGGIYSSEWFWSKILHVLRADAQVKAKAYSWIEHCDWIPALLTGKTRPEELKRGRCSAGHKAMWHPEWNGLPPNDFFTSLDPILDGVRDRLFMDQTYTADIPVGNLSAEWAERLGLSPSVVVGGGAFDCHAGAVGAAIQSNEMVKVIGTSTCDIMVAPHIDNCVRGICGQVEGSVIPGLTGLEAGQSAFGDIYAWFKRLLGWAGEVSLPKLEADAAQVAPGSNDIMAIDWFNGRRTPDADQLLTGAIFGMNLGSSAPMVFRALVESTAFGARRIIERFENEGVPVKSVVAIGGIALKSPFVMQICADVFNRQIKVTASSQACALGAAIFGAVASGVHPSTEEAIKKMASKADKVYTPNPANVAIYEKLYTKYCRYSAALEKEIHHDV